MLGVLCEEFHCLPSQAWAEVQRLPAGFLEQVIEYRRYADAYYSNKADPKGWGNSPMRQLAAEIEHTLMEDEIARG